MIEFPIILGSDGRPLVRQVLTHPAVYPDTWLADIEGRP